MTFYQIAKGTATLAKWAAERAVIDAACAVTGDEMTVELARSAKLTGQPRALKHLDNYLKAGGDIQVSIRELLAEDDGVRERFYSEVTKALDANSEKGSNPHQWQTKGSVGIPQRYYTNAEWKNALGSINMNWILDGQDIVASFVNVYRWHPEDNTRVSQCVHRAADNLKEKGAKDYNMVGTSTRIPVSEFTGVKPR